MIGIEDAYLPAYTGIVRAPDSDKWSSNSTQETFGWSEANNANGVLCNTYHHIQIRTL